ncbi:hypothetical protein QR52_06655 [Bordetella pertussis]|nr:hypothetical protein UN82_06525 [Bordetella pertussis]ALX25596.1 hypothetical protein RD18_12865 [Bordetella pertussis]AMS50932.1 hypothetical protein RD08_06525 [Bordetella pertussis]AMS54571.1 hypothetical protein RD09_06645 [Bordetella pertussis]AMS59288.1 hypothetical protein RD11_13015 [Bordetella pertussis]
MKILAARQPASCATATPALPTRPAPPPARAPSRRHRIPRGGPAPPPAERRPARPRRPGPRDAPPPAPALPGRSIERRLAHGGTAPPRQPVAGAWHAQQRGPRVPWNTASDP